ncbi:MAG: ABC transporter, ATP-binding protein (cluster 5, nickel/peptides/opines), partial [uncultured Thermomicrobiales bacterium]
GDRPPARSHPRDQGLWGRVPRQRGRDGRLEQLLAPGRRRAAGDHGDRRGEREREDDARPAAAGVGGADDRRGAVPWQGSAGAVAGGATALPARRAGDFSGPLRGLQPVLQGRPRPEHPDRQIRPGEVQGRGAGPDGGNAERGRAPAGGNAGAASASALRWAAAADHGRAGALAPAAPDHRRRAGLDGGRLAAGDHPRKPASVAPAVRDLDRLHHPRPDDGLPDRPQHRGHVSGRGGGSGGRRAGGQDAAPPLHPTPDRVHPLGRPEPTLAAPRAAGRRGGAGGDRGGRVQVRRPLPVRDAGLPGGGAAVVPHRVAAGGGLLLVPGPADVGRRGPRPGDGGAGFSASPHAGRRRL